MITRMFSTNAPCNWLLSSKPPVLKQQLNTSYSIKMYIIKQKNNKYELKNIWFIFEMIE